MHIRLVSLVVVSSVLASLAPVTAVADQPPVHRRTAVTVSAPSEVVEGDRYEVVVKLGRTAGAERLVVQQLVTPPYGTPSWETVAQTRVRGKKYVVRAVAGAGDTDRFRARVTYAHARPVRSKASRTTVWHWLPLSRFAYYRTTSGVFESIGVAMNGRQYNGWSTYGSYPSWETGYTLGRHCRAVRGDAGVADSSAPGSSATLQLVADETTTAFASGPLTPGMVQPVQVDLATPYRLTVRAQDTSPAGVRAYPAFGDPELLCTGVE